MIFLGVVTMVNYFSDAPIPGLLSLVSSWYFIGNLHHYFFSYSLNFLYGLISLKLFSSGTLWWNYLWKDSSWGLSIPCKSIIFLYLFPVILSPMNGNLWFYPSLYLIQGVILKCSHKKIEINISIFNTLIYSCYTSYEVTLKNYLH